MSDLTRRGFVKSSAGVAGAAAGMTALGTLVTEQAEAKEGTHGHPHPVVAYVRDARSGEISVMSGNREVRVRDRKLAARIARAAR